MKMLMDMHEHGFYLRETLTLGKAIGHFSPYGSYWVAMCLIYEGADDKTIEKFAAHVETWSCVHPLLRPRALHLRAELASRSDSDSDKVTMLHLN
jgi:hypothetical protein